MVTYFRFFNSNADSAGMDLSPILKLPNGGIDAKVAVIRAVKGLLRYENRIRV